jgi:hypothetical protein
MALGQFSKMGIQIPYYLQEWESKYHVRCLKLILRKPKGGNYAKDNLCSR